MRRRSRFRRTFRRRLTAKRPIRRRRVTRRTRVSSRRILQVASIKKRNAMACTTLGSNVTPAGFVTLESGLNVFLWCPSYMNHENATQSEYVRNRNTIFFRGFKDNWTFANGGLGNWVHRRIVFWSHQQYPAGIPVESATSPEVFFRPLNVLDLSVVGNQKFMETMFQGSLGVDYTNFSNATVDRRRVGLVSDRKIRIRPTYSATNADGDFDGTIQKSYTTSTFVNRNITYDDEERGFFDVPGDDGEEPGGPGDGHGSPWSVTGPVSPGNLYVMDIFILGVLGKPPNTPLPGEARAIVQTDAMVYWHER